MKLYIIFLMCFIIAGECQAKKKSAKIKNQSQPAILAIQIVDPNENSTSSKNSKRTIESSLGYGYQNVIDGGAKPRYEVYKYSQHDIPPYKGDSSKVFQAQKIEVKKSVQYVLPSITETRYDNKAITPGTTLYSSLDDKGQIGGLSSKLPQIESAESADQPVPVIVLRIFPNQLKDSTIHANLPSTHPFASAINSVDIQSLLAHYIKALQNAEGQQRHRQQYSSVQQYVTQPEEVYSQQTYHQQISHQPDTQTYPQNYQYSEQKQVPYPDYQHANKYDIPVRDDINQQREQYYSTSAYIDQNQEYKRPVQQYYYQPQYEPAENGYQADNGGQYQQQQQYYTQEDTQNSELLTHENYPTEKHTRVVFRTQTGQIRVPEYEKTTAKEIKTIKIQVPENIAKVEVEETERPYGYENYQEKEQNDQNYYAPQGAVQQQQQHYSDSESSQSNTNNYDEVIKYYMKHYYNQDYYSQMQPTEETLESNTPYEEVVSSTSAPRRLKKRVKGKKRTQI